MTGSRRPRNSSRQQIQARLAQRRWIRPSASWRMPRLPSMVPRSATVTISPNGVTRFWSGIPAGLRAPGLPAALGAPLLVELLDPGKLPGGQVAVDGPDVRLQLLDGPSARDDAMHARLG